jgi:hypothetical protein
MADPAKTDTEPTPDPPAADPPAEPKPEPKTRKTKEPSTTFDSQGFLDQVDKRVGETVHKILDERVAPEPPKEQPKEPTIAEPGKDTLPDKPSLADRLLGW